MSSFDANSNTSLIRHITHFVVKPHEQIDRKRVPSSMKLQLSIQIDIKDVVGLIQIRLLATL